MSKHKKKSVIEESIPNFTDYTYSNTIMDFANAIGLQKVICAVLNVMENINLKRNLNSFNDTELNDHLYRIYYAKCTDSTLVLRRWIVYYVKQYPKQISQRVNKYLDSKKLTLEEWLRSVKDGRRGDILCIYLLSMATGTHVAVHLNENRIWSTLEAIHSSHDDLMQQCDKHLVYLGLGVFLQLKE